MAITVLSIPNSSLIVTPLLLLYTPFRPCTTWDIINRILTSTQIGVSCRQVGRLFLRCKKVTHDPNAGPKEEPSELPLIHLYVVGSPLLATYSIASTNRSSSSSVVYTFGVTRKPWNSSCIMGTTMMRCLAHRYSLSLTVSTPSI